MVGNELECALGILEARMAAPEISHVYGLFCYSERYELTQVTMTSFYNQVAMAQGNISDRTKRVDRSTSYPLVNSLDMDEL